MDWKLWLVFTGFLIIKPSGGSSLLPFSDTQEQRGNGEQECANVWEKPHFLIDWGAIKILKYGESAQGSFCKGNNHLHDFEAALYAYDPDTITVQINSTLKDRSKYVLCIPTRNTDQWIWKAFNNDPAQENQYITIAMRDENIADPRRIKRSPPTFEKQFSLDLQELIFDDSKENFYGVKEVKLAGKQEMFIIIRLGIRLIGLEYNRKQWNKKWEEKVFNENNNDPSPEMYQWFTGDILGQGNDMVIIRNEKYLSIFEISRDFSGIKLLTSDGAYHDAYHWWRSKHSLIFGYFYPDENALGILTNNKKKVQFYAINTEAVTKRKKFPLWELDNGENEQLNSSQHWYFTGSLNKAFSQESIISVGPTNIDIYKFNQDYRLNLVYSFAPLENVNEKYILFGNITNRKMKDLLIFDEFGLHLYQYNDIKLIYNLIDIDTTFSKNNGWQQNFFNSLQLVDLNKDGLDELIFIGVRGLTSKKFDLKLEEWVNFPILKQKKEIYPSQIHIICSKKTKENFIFIQSKRNGIQWGLLKEWQKEKTLPVQSELQLSIKQPPKEVVFYENSFKIKKRLPFHTKPILRWADQHTSVFLKDAVDIMTGQLAFSVPLASFQITPHFKTSLYLSYNSLSDSASIVGTGWNINLGKNYITADYRGSIFSEDHTFYLLTDNVYAALNKTSENTIHMMFTAKINNDNNSIMNIIYERNNERWIVTTEKEKWTYGDCSGGNRAIQWTLSGKQWRGYVQATDQLEQLPLAWYMCERADSQTLNKIVYEYESDSKIIGKNTLTSSMRVAKIGILPATSITFRYEAKNSVENYENSPLDDQEVLKFPTPLVENKFLKSYEIETPNYRQHIQFNYQLIGEHRILNAMSQYSGKYSENIFNFNYNSITNYPVISKISSIFSNTFDFTYTKSRPPRLLNEDKVVKYPAYPGFQLVNGPDYKIFAYLHVFKENSITVSILNEAGTKKQLPLTIESKMKKVENFQVIAFEKLIMVVLIGSNNQEVRLIENNNKKWSVGTNYWITDKKAIIQITEGVIVIADEQLKKTLIYDRNNHWAEVNLNLSFFSGLIVDNTRVIGFERDQLTIVFYNSKTKKWALKRTPIKKPDNCRVVKSFDLTLDLQQNICTALESRSLQVLNNMVAISSLKDLNGNVNGVLNIYLLDENYNIASTYEKLTISENLYNKKQTIPTDEIDLIIGYKKINGLYRIQVVDLKGRKIDELKDLSNDEREKIINKSKDELNNNQELVAKFKPFILITWNRYFNTLTQLGVVFAGVTEDTEKIIKRTGQNWIVDDYKKQKVTHLGKHMELHSNDNKHYQIYNRANQNQPLTFFRTSEAGQVINRFPAYIGFRSDENITKIITFKDERTLDKTLKFKGEHLLGASDYSALLTRAESTTLAHTSVDDIIVRPVSSFYKVKERPEVIKKIVSDKTAQRYTRYNRTSTFDFDTFTQTVSEIPTQSEFDSGWTEYTYSVDDDSALKESSTKYYDSTGNLVKSEDQKIEEKSNNSNSKASRAMLWDKSGEWLISNFYPYSLSENEAAYHGFETYEEKHVWNYNENNVVKKEFSFSGENYLKLNEKNGDTIKGALSLKQDIYVASCWARTQKNINLGSVATFFTATIATFDTKIITLNGEVKQKSGPWSYIEIILDYEQMKKIYSLYLKKNSNNFTSIDHIKPTFTVNIEVSARDQIYVDLDHLRYSSMNVEFSANVYNLENGLLTSTINNNGLVNHYLYDFSQRQIASNYEDGQVEEFTSESTTGNLLFGEIDEQPKSLITIKPSSGYVEMFDPWTLNNRWVLTKNEWIMAPRQFEHQDWSWSQICSVPILFHPSSSAIRMLYSLPQSAELKLHWADNIILAFAENNGMITAKLENNLELAMLPQTAEIIVLREKGRFVLWINGVLVFDKSVVPAATLPWTKFCLSAKGSVQISDLIVMNNPQIKVEYFNGMGDKSQIILFENENTVIVSQILFDKLGRESINTKATRVTRQPTQSIFNHYSNFVTNANPYQNSSVWHTGKLDGLVNSLNPNDLGYPYKQTEYYPSPLKEKIKEGLPGAEFSIHGLYSKQFAQTCDIPIIINQYPKRQGYKKEVEKGPNGSQHVNVFDRDKNNVAKYVRTAGYDHILTTFEYDDHQRLTKILPPNYHEQVNTSSKTGHATTGEANLTKEEVKQQAFYGTFLKYNKDGQVIKKSTPDTGVQEFLYNSQGELRFSFTKSGDEVSDIIYYQYDSGGDLSETGYLMERVSNEELQRNLDNLDDNFEKKMYQKIVYFDSHPEPQSRGRLKVILTSGQYSTVLEKLRFSADDNVIEKNTISMGERSAPFTDVKKEYSMGRIKTLQYPTNVSGVPLRLEYHYNKRGFLESLGLPGLPNYFAQFQYSGEGRLIAETDNLNPQTFIRKFKYSSPGFLTEINDPFLEEYLGYTEGGYGQKGFGDGIIMKTSFVEKWHSEANEKSFEMPQNMPNFTYFEICRKYLQESGYISNSGETIKLLIPSAELEMPLLCSGNSANQLAKMLATFQRPKQFGHCYSYGNHQELVKAKYFSGLKCPAPFQPDSFSHHIDSLTQSQSFEIWNILTKQGFIIEKQKEDSNSVYYGSQGISFLRDGDLEKQLELMTTENKLFSIYHASIQKLATHLVSNREFFSLEDFNNIYLKWRFGMDGQNDKKLNQYATLLYKMLISHNFLPNSDPFLCLNANFKTSLKKYSSIIPEIIKTMNYFFNNALGTNPFDESLYEMDPNGNIIKFNRGFNHYNIEYENHTNKIENIKLMSAETDGTDEVQWHLKHDVRGNVIKAEHKNIQEISYHPVSQRTTAIAFTDGSGLRFDYDSRGERILKQFFNKNRDLEYEIYYLRDDDGKVLMEQRTTYTSHSDIDQQTVTAYIYGTRGLLGFIRNGEHYSVTIDHAGSIRLVIRNNQVVAAYEYMPYGELMRVYGNDPNAHIMYRYTGQEYDPESGLYNYHARLYDPTIGRFYQADPQAQYASPYKYAGNSPISFTDPDGQFAFLLFFAVVLAIGGGYLGGAAANNSWNPAKWKFNTATVLGVLGGALAGALLPFGFAGSVATIAAVGQAAGLSATAALTIGAVATTTLGLGGAYLTTVASNNGTWDLTKWQWDSPGTYSSLFQGFGTGSGIFAGVGVTHQYAAKLGQISKFRKYLFLTASYGAGGAGLYAGGVVSNNGEFNLAKWNWNSATTYLGLVNGFDSIMGWPQNVLQLGKGTIKALKNAKALKNIASKIKPSLLKKLAPTLKDPKSPMYKVAFAGMAAYYTGSAANGNFTHWRNEYSTYEAVINGIFLGKDFTNTKKLSETENLRKIGLENIPSNAKNSMKKTWKKITDATRHTLYSGIKGGLISLHSVKNILKKFHKETGDSYQKTYSATPINNKLIESKKVKFTESDAGVKKIVDFADELKRIEDKEGTLHTDEVVNFLPCGRKLRKRRQANSRSAICHMPDANSDIMDNAIKGKDIFKSVKSILGEIPKDHSTNDPNFYHNFFLGAITTLPKNLFENIQGIYISRTKTGREFGKSSRLNPNLDPANVVDQSQQLLIVSKPENGKAQVTMLTTKYVSGYDKSKKYISLDIKNKLKNSWEANKIANVEDFNRVIGDLPRGTEVEIHAHTLAIGEDKSILFHNEKRLTLNDLVESKNHQSLNDGPIILPNESSHFQKIDVNPTDYHQHINDIFNNQANNNQVEGVKNLMDAMLNDYKASQALMSFRDKDAGIIQNSRVTPKEADFHGYLTGALSLNFKKEFNMDILVEPIAGKGYGDLAFLIKKNQETTDWNSPSILLELKSTKDAGEVEAAVKQIHDNGYLYNLPLKTLSDHAIIAGINSNTMQVTVKSVPIPKYTGVAETLLSKPTKASMEKALNDQHMMYSDLANKKKDGNEYMSHFILGEIISRPELHGSYVLNDGKGPMHVLYSLNSEPVLLTLVDIKDHSNSPNVVLPISNGQNIKHYTIKKELVKVIGSKGKPIKETQVRFNFAEHISTFPTSEEHNFKKINIVDTNEIFRKTEIPTTKVLDDLSETVKEFPSLLKDESDFQAILHGVLLGNKKAFEERGKMMRVYQEANLSNIGRLDLIAQVLDVKKNAGKVSVREDYFSVMELKGDKNIDISKSVKTAKNEIYDYMNNQNLHAVTDLEKVETLAIAYKDGAVEYQKTDYLVHPIEAEGNKRERSPELSELGDLLHETKIGGRGRAKRSINLNESKISPIQTHQICTLNCLWSGSAQLQPLFYQLVQSMNKMVFKITDIFFNPNVEYEVPQFARGADPDMSMLEMGDQWVQQTNLQGNLLWATIISRKLGGIVPDTRIFKRPDFIRELDIYATNLVYETTEKLLSHAETCGLDGVLREILERADNQRVVRKIYVLINSGDFESVPKVLYQELVFNNIKEMVAKSSEQQVYDFLEEISKGE